MSNPTEQELRTAKDRELVILAAKAAELRTYGRYDFQFGLEVMRPHSAPFAWNPRNDDGDSRRLEVDLNIEVRFHLAGDNPGVSATCAADSRIPVMHERFGSDRRAATRLAVLRAAAEVGKAMP